MAKKNKNDSPPNRGGVWSTWLVLLMLHGIGAGILVYYSMNTQYANYKTIILPSLVIAAFLQIICSCRNVELEKVGTLYVCGGCIHSNGCSYCPHRFGLRCILRCYSIVDHRLFNQLSTEDKIL